MKTLLITISVFLTASVNFAQNFNPFHSPSRYVQTGDTNETYFFAEHATLNGNTLEIKQYQEASEFFEMDEFHIDCGSYGAPLKAKNNWLGRNINYNQTTQVLAMDSSLTFNLGINLGDSSLIKTINNIEYYLKYVSKSEEVILNFSDSIKYFSIVAYDNSGNLVNTNYSATPLRIGKELGAIKFINIQEFPFNAKEYEIMGQVNSNQGHLGDYALTNDEVYPWDVGDTLQVFRYSNQQYDEGFPPQGGSSYSTYTILSRTETADSVIIHLTQDYFVATNPGFYTEITYPEFIRYKKGSVFSTYPANYYENMNSYHSREVAYESQTGPGLVMSDFIYADYCDSCHCFTAFELYQIHFDTYKIMAPYGKVHAEKTTYDGSMNFNAEAKLIYAKVGNNVLGNFVHVGVDNLELPVINIAPNPVNKVLEISTSERMQNLEIYTATGAKCLEKTTQNQTESLNVNALEPGVYLVVITFENGQQSTQRIVKQ